MNKKPTSPAPREAVGVMPINLVISPVRVEPTATVTCPPTAVGGPIMREGFITGTGFLITPAKL